MKNESLSLSTSVKHLKGVGKAICEKLNQKGIFTLSDLLFILPYKYEDRTKIHPINELVQGQTAQLLVSVISSNIQYGRKRSLVLNCSDETGVISLRLFHFSNAQMKLLHAGSRLLIYGQVSQTITKLGASVAMMHPEIKKLSSTDEVKLSDGLTPVYPSTLGVGNTRLKQWINMAISCLSQKTDLYDFSDEFLQKNELNKLIDALNMIHQPSSGLSEDELLATDSPNRRRLAFDELLAKQIVMIKKKQMAQKDQSKVFVFNEVIHREFLNRVGFNLTFAQSRAIKTIINDLQNPYPMQRLLQGDVGSGKTIVAFLAALQVVIQAKQVVIMAPTEVLAEQHYKEACELFEPLDITPCFLVSKQSAKQKRQVLQNIKSGEARMIIGTHALFQDEVEYQNLSLVIIDEQHRFGVAQRLQLKEKSSHSDYVPHTLIMTATPIPRTLAMSHYGDLDTSVLDELPPNRKSIDTLLLPDSKRDELIERIQNLINLGQQVYWVCPLIDDSEVLQAQAAQSVFEQLSAVLPNIKIGLLHGKQRSDEKEVIINQFKANQLKLLVSTTVIEVGVNVPNATLMVIENAERFGLAQLHQLRGRVGRGAKKSYCVLLYQSPLSETAKKRLSIMKESQDGFEIAQQDLAIRGAGEVLGTRQTGEMILKIANLSEDEDLLKLAYETAENLLINQPDLANSISKRWVGRAEDYLSI